MSFLSDAYGFLQIALGLNAFLRETISVEAATAYVCQRMQTRDAAFLQMIERCIFANSRSPYLKLFRAAGCELSDVRNMVKKEGIEKTLQQLFQAGIYVTFEEFKGRTPAVRGSQIFTFSDADFDNPLITAHYYSSTGGTSGRPTRISINLEHIAQSAPPWALWFAAHDLVGSPLVFWTPNHSGIANSQLRFAKFGKKLDKWFAITDMGTVKDRLISACVHNLLRWTAGFPKPESAPLSEAWKVGEYLVKMIRNGMRPCINTSPSGAVRVCLAMQEYRVSFQNIKFLTRGEPLTSAHRETIEAAGAKAVATYGFSEGGPVGSQCPNVGAADDVHIFLDAFAVIHRARPLGDGQNVDALLLTALRPACPKIMLNTEIGDYAVLETRQCGCLFDEVGYFKHLHTIRSFDKLTGEGVTFVGADIFHLMEEVFPKRFGGTVTDYQLVEEQDDCGLPHYTLLISPDVGALDENAVVAAFLEELGKMKSKYCLMANLWVQANILHVKRLNPIPTERGKIPSFRTLGRQ